MRFNSVEYAVLLVAVLGVYWVLPRRPQNVVLVVASYVFYGWWDARFLVLLAGSTLIDYGFALRIDAAAGRARRRWLVAALVANLGILGFFKYWGFFTESAAELARLLGVDWAPPVLEVVLPVGISFYTFQSMAYAVDVYRGDVAPCRSLLDYAAFLSFFPQLVAGPIERASHMFPQFADRRTRPDGATVASAVTLIVSGLVRKVVIADTLAPIVADGFSPGAGGGVALLAVYAFALQIYGDFAGYSAIARGSARLLGFELVVNFRAPYLSASPAEFWRRWHMSLSSWLRDYLYVPLGGNRNGQRRQQVNLALVMLIGGLWHGASWTFVAWGGIHGALLALHRAWTAGRPPATSPVAVRVVATFHATCLAWVFFRAETFGQAAEVLRAIAGGPLAGIGLGHGLLVAGAALATLALDRLVLRDGDESGLARWRPAPRGAVLGAAVLSLLVFAGAEPVPFIYFQF